MSGLLPKSVAVWTLVLDGPGEHRPSNRTPSVEWRVEQCRRVTPEMSRFLYTAVGSGLYWVDRLEWSREQWDEYVTSPGMEQWLIHVEGAVAGYFELIPESFDEVARIEIRSFGLLSPFRGLGLGGVFLDAATERALSLAPTVWLSTCSADHPAALDNYISRGFRVVKEERFLKQWPAISPTFWNYQSPR